MKKIIQKISVCNLMSADQDRILDLITELGETPKSKNTIKLADADKKNSSGKPINNISFHDLLVLKFNYSAYRGNFYPRLFSRLGIKSCVYCNSQLALNVEKNTYTQAGKLNGRLKVAKYQLDHAYSKADYPYLSATIYNLYPCCAVCNNVKRKKKVNFKLYGDAQLQSNYTFSLKDSLTEYMLCYDPEKLMVYFDDPDKPLQNREGKGSLEDTFHISSIYNAQKDLAEEIIIRTQIYNQTYRKDLEESFRTLFPGSGFSIERFFLGTYPDSKDIHRRPLSKFTQDISKEVSRLSSES
ncbi:hypothetical protein [Flavobacterium sp. ASV13]|uniref:hypothetical protein n=1 Tax=Flavobacterium sp. ASV13 TaxID=1506583 RepID=UPI00126797DA|nr:hypothetical protein [Flavobacterium sp. ASV13]